MVSNKKFSNNQFNLIDGTLTGTTIPVQSEYESNGNEGYSTLPRPKTPFLDREGLTPLQGVQLMYSKHQLSMNKSKRKFSFL